MHQRTQNLFALMLKSICLMSSFPPPMALENWMRKIEPRWTGCAGMPDYCLWQKMWKKIASICASKRKIKAKNDGFFLILPYGQNETPQAGTFGSRLPACGDVVFLVRAAFVGWSGGDYFSFTNFPVMWSISMEKSCTRFIAGPDISRSTSS